MANINFDDGFESFTINNDPSRVIRINPKDTNIVARFEDVMRDLKTESSQIAELEVRADGSLVRSPGKSYEEGLEHLKKFNQLICEKLNYIFNADVSDVVFGKQSPLSLVGPENRFLFEVFL